MRSVSRATELDRLLRECSFPSIAIHSGLAQDERIKRYQQFKDFEKRILVATDIFGRGIDVVSTVLLGAGSAINFASRNASTLSSSESWLFIP